jgi:hypothetical protein
MSTTTDSKSDPRRLGYLNAVLTVIAVMLGLLVADRLVVAPPAAEAVQPAGRTDQPGRGAGLVSAADQRKAMLTELRKMSTKLDQLEKTIKSGGLSVKVTEMPEIKIPQQQP